MPNVTTAETRDDVEKMTGELIHAQAAHLRGLDIGRSRAEEIAADIGRIVEAVSAVRERLDFNDEPARLERLLNAAPAPPGQRK